LPSSATLATPRPISGVVAGSGDGTGSCAIVVDGAPDCGEVAGYDR
jgi:hypothetical protein